MQKKGHSLNPKNRKTWRCKCGLINIPEASECKGILMEKQGLIRPKRQGLIKPKRKGVSRTKAQVLAERERDRPFKEKIQKEYQERQEFAESLVKTIDEWLYSEED